MMKIKLLLILFICLSLFSQTNIIIKNSWLQTGSYSLHNSQRMQNAVSTLSLDPINLDISNCLTNMQSEGITNQPIFGIDNSQPSGTDWMLDYHTAFTYYGLNRVLNPNEYGATVSNPGGDSYTGLYSQASIVLNSDAGSPWNSDGNVDINTVLRHEVGHLYGLDDYEEWGTITLMNPLEKDYVNYLDQNSINGLRIIFEEPTTTIDGGSTIESGSDFSYNINFPVIEYGPDFGEIPDGFGFHSYLYKEGVLQNTEPFIPIHVLTDEDGIQLFTNSLSTSDLALGEYTVRTYSAMFWNSSTGDITLYETHNRPFSEVLFKVVAAPEIESPSPNDIHNISPNDKGIVSDTLVIKVKVPEVQSSYPDINIKIDDSYVNQGDITFDSGENIWIYNWDLSSLNPGTLGKRYKITAEIASDSSDCDVSSVYLVEAIYHEDFEVITDLTTAGWNFTTAHSPDPVTQDGWFIGNKTEENNNGCAMSVTKPNQNYIWYRLWSPVITLPSVTDSKIKLSHRVFYDGPNPPDPHSILRFCITNSSQSIISGWTTLSSVDGSWIDNEYDLTPYAGQDIKIHWFHNYYDVPMPPPLPITEYTIDDIVIYIIPDMEGPNIDFITGNTAEPNEDMNLVLEFNDTSGIDEVTADYSIEGDSGTITLNPVKGTYNYTGMISGRDHECNGSISYRIVDSVGNETISGGRTINWASGGFVLGAPENILISQPNDSTLSISWDVVEGATGYNVYSSLDPYGTFSLDTTGTFTQSREWQKVIDGNEYFYYIKASDTSKEEEEYLKKVQGYK